MARAQAQNAADAAALAGGVVARLRQPGRHRRGAGSGADRRSAAQHLGRAGRAGLADDADGAVSGRLAVGGRATASARPSSQHAAAGVLLAPLRRRIATNVRASASAKVMTRQRDDVPAAVGDRRTRWTDRRSGHLARGRRRFSATPRVPDARHPVTRRASAHGVRVPSDVAAGTAQRPADEPARHRCTLEPPTMSRSISRRPRRRLAARATATGEHRPAATACRSTIGDRVGVPRRRSTTPPIDAAEALIDSDPGAYWDGTGDPRQRPRFGGSPRLMTIAVVDPDEFSLQARPSPGTRSVARIRNLVGFFVERTRGRRLRARRRAASRPPASSVRPADTVAPNVVVPATVALVRWSRVMERREP